MIGAIARRSGTAATRVSPSAGWRLIVAHSSSLSGAELDRNLAGTWTFPMSWSRPATRQRRNRDENGVAGGVAEEVVDVLEIVDLDAQDADGLVAEAGQARLQRATIPHSGQRVELRHALRFGFGRLGRESGGLDRCHVEHRSVQHSASVLNAQASAVAHPPHAAVGAHDSILDVQPTGLVRAVVRLVKHIHIQGGGR